MNASIDLPERKAVYQRSNACAARERKKSQRLMKDANNVTPTSTTSADPISSSRVGHETRVISSRTSCKNVVTRLTAFIIH